MQLTGGQFTLSTALAGNDLATFPDFPAEIRAPQGTLFGVSAFQINFGSTAIETAGDAPDVLVAMNPAALKTNLEALKPGGLIIADTGEFTKRNLDKAKYEANPLEDGSLAKWRRAGVRHQRADARGGQAVRPRQQGRAALQEHVDAGPGAVDVRPRPRSRSSTGSRPSSRQPELADANIAALNAGHAYGETAELGGPLKQGPRRRRSTAEPGLYRTITGAEAVSLGLVAGAQLADLPMFFGGYPITPASRDPAPPGAAQGVRRHHLPGRGRDRRDLRRDRRVLRRPARRHLVVGPGHRAQGRGDGPRDHDRAAAGDRQLAARRPLDRACRPRPSSATSTRRSTAATATRRCR